MGHGYFTVIGYGLIINISDFINVFPDTFELSKRNNYSVNEDVMNDIENYYPKLSFHCER